MNILEARVRGKYKKFENFEKNFLRLKVELEETERGMVESIEELNNELKNLTNEEFDKFAKETGYLEVNDGP